MLSGIVIVLVVAAVFATTAGSAGLFVTTYTFATIAWLFALRRGAAPSSWNILLVALALRGTAVFFEPTLSTDVYRYVWDGRVAADGINPYRFSPIAPELAHLREDWHGRINHPEIRTIYPPHAQLFFWLTGLVGFGVTGWKLLLIVFDLLTLGMLSRRSPAAAYAWASCPLVIIEGFASGHLEIIAAGLVLAAFFLLRDQVWRPAALLAVAAGLKLIPIFAPPAFLRFESRRWRWITVFVIVFAAPLLAFRAAGPLMPGFREYAFRWSFNSPMYSGTFALVEGASLAAHLKDLWTFVKDPLHLEGFAPVVYRHLYSDFLARGILFVILVVASILVARRSRELVTAIQDLIGVALLCSPAIHPWYWLVILPLALLRPRRIWLALALASPVSYLLYAQPSLEPAVFFLAYGLPALVVASIHERTPAGPASGLRARLINRLMAFRGSSSS